MRRLISIIVSLCVAVFCCGALLGCGEHEHVGEGAYGSDLTHHWKVCEICEGPFNTEEHDFDESMDGLKVIKTCKICEYSTEVKEVAAHEHTYGDAFEYNEAFHFKTCTFTDCVMQAEKVEHIFGTPEIVQETGKITTTTKCQFCDYAKVEVITVETVVKDETSWTRAFENLELKNFEMRVSFSHEDYPEMNYDNYCIVTEDGAYVSYGDDSRIVYTKKQANGEFAYYLKDYYTDGWKFYNDKEGEFYNGFSREAVLQIDFKEHFNEFVYDEEKGAYTCDSEVQCTAYMLDGSVYPEKLFCYNSVVKVADGKITHIECDYRFETQPENMKTKFIYFNIGLASFEIPEEVKTNAIPSGDYVGVGGSGGSNNVEQSTTNQKDPN